VHAFSPPEIVHISKLYGAGLKETISRLHDAGLDSIPGGGAEILDDRVRDSVSPEKIGWKKWQEVMLAAHSLGIPTTATMVFGHAETLEERIKHIISGARDATKISSWFYCIHTVDVPIGEHQIEWDFHGDRLPQDRCSIKNSS